ncbi:hypothetical protein BS50DRAFT_134361 [Corynespora cassiicola Philippines]|uniref:Uncharacterized protein n=1 Tax=Corynespora cassiicola Philippines TaxID=1448308 RepID=A0A2T2NA90_CORCC|nr:hypothetical protein BS50DRAFT_134361 [Corynespora cassiicola Philippines]
MSSYVHPLFAFSWFGGTYFNFSSMGFGGFAFGWVRFSLGWAWFGLLTWRSRPFLVGHSAWIGVFAFSPSGWRGLGQWINTTGKTRELGFLGSGYTGNLGSGKNWESEARAGVAVVRWMHMNERSRKKRLNARRNE